MALCLVAARSLNKRQSLARPCRLRKHPEMVVYAGTINQFWGSWKSVPRNSAANTTSGRIIEAVERAEKSRAPIVRKLLIA